MGLETVLMTDGMGLTSIYNVSKFGAREKSRICIRAWAFGSCSDKSLVIAHI